MHRLHFYWFALAFTITDHVYRPDTAFRLMMVPFGDDGRCRLAEPPASPTWRLLRKLKIAQRDFHCTRVVLLHRVRGKCVKLQKPSLVNGRRIATEFGVSTVTANLIWCDLILRERALGRKPIRYILRIFHRWGSKIKFEEENHNRCRCLMEMRKNKCTGMIK